MPYLNADGKNTFECIECHKVKHWYEFPIKESTRLKKGELWVYGKQYNEPLKRKVCFKCLQQPVRYKIKNLMNEASARNMNSLREKLFDAMDGLTNKTVTIGEAKAICEVAQVIINTAKVEIDFIKAIGAKKGGDFIQIEV